jgi:hypothetical protein
VCVDFAVLQLSLKFYVHTKNNVQVHPPTLGARRDWISKVRYLETQTIVLVTETLTMLKTIVLVTLY